MQTLPGTFEKWLKDAMNNPNCEKIRPLRLSEQVYQVEEPEDADRHNPCIDQVFHKTGLHEQLIVNYQDRVIAYHLNE